LVYSYPSTINRALFLNQGNFIMICSVCGGTRDAVLLTCDCRKLKSTALKDGLLKLKTRWETKEDKQEESEQSAWSSCWGDSPVKPCN